MGDTYMEVMYDLAGGLGIILAKPCWSNVAQRRSAKHMGKCNKGTDIDSNTVRPRYSVILLSLCLTIRTHFLVTFSIIFYLQ